MLALGRATQIGDHGNAEPVEDLDVGVGGIRDVGGTDQAPGSNPAAELGRSATEIPEVLDP